MNSKTVHTGQKVKFSGQYHPSGGNTEWTLIRGKRVPPNPEGVRQTFTLVDKTKHHKGS
jgi:hypothetical protein